MCDSLNQLGDEAITIKNSKGFSTIVPQDWDTNPDKIVARIALIQSEASEMVEAFNKEHNKTHFIEEGIDVIIRTIEILRGLDADIDKELDLKMEKNRSRPAKHGDKLIN
jgi:NTP pyrophosphatase (non-canonical NTP hydrolase)